MTPATSTASVRTHTLPGQERQSTQRPPHASHLACMSSSSHSPSLLPLPHARCSRSPVSCGSRPACAGRRRDGHRRGEASGWRLCAVSGQASCRERRHRVHPVEGRGGVGAVGQSGDGGPADPIRHHQRPTGEAAALPRREPPRPHSKTSTCHHGQQLVLVLVLVLRVALVTVIAPAQSARAIVNHRICQVCHSQRLTQCLLCVAPCLSQWVYMLFQRWSQ